MMCQYNYKYSCADFTFPLLPHDKVLQLIKLLGMDAIDIGLFEGRSHLYPSYISEDPVGKAHILSQKLKQEDLEVADVFLQTGAEPSVAATNSPDEAIRVKNRTLFLKILSFVNALGCRHITGLPGVFHKRVNFEEDWNRACEETIWRVKAAEAKNIIYAVEAHVGSILPDAETSMRFIKACPGLTLTLDYGHFIYQGQTNKSVHPLIPYASHFHARGGAKGKLQTIVKENKIDFKTILSELAKNKYPGFICMEYTYQDWEGCNRTDNVSETVLLKRILKNKEFLF